MTRIYNQSNKIRKTRSDKGRKQRHIADKTKRKIYYRTNNDVIESAKQHKKIYRLEEGNESTSTC